MIDEHNFNPKNTYQMEINQFADLTKEEFMATYLSLEQTQGLKKKKT